MEMSPPTNDTDERNEGAKTKHYDNRSFAALPTILCIKQDNTWLIIRPGTTAVTFSIPGFPAQFSAQGHGGEICLALRGNWDESTSHTRDGMCIEMYSEWRVTDLARHVETRVPPQNLSLATCKVRVLRI
ncbi:uncharacterized protein [Physcomitrium patens]|uniref:uncharacterized protein n=1 Tax=Physcomitrium patens TaxID=3218 RepID=UPI003CCD5785